MTPTNAEKKVLLDHLQEVREHALGTLEGLGEADLHRSLLPSGWSFLGMISHLTLDVERLWFQAVVAGDRTAQVADRATDAWFVPLDTPAALILRGYREAADRSDTIIAAAALDTAPRWWPDGLGSWRLDSLRDVLLHVITETACHAGHLDAARELVDGHQWIVLS